MKNKAIACIVNKLYVPCLREHLLDKLLVGTHESNPAKVECTYCESFKVKSE